MFLPGARQPSSSPRRRVSRDKAIPAPIGGWVSAQNLAASAAGTCLVLDNMYPTTTGLRIRGGNRLHATVGSVPVQSLMGYVGGTVKSMFAAAGGSVYNITTVANPAIPPAPAFSGQTSNYYAHVNFATTGGYFMYAVNGTDLARLYNGTTWTAINGASVPAITGATTSTFSHVNVYRNRIYFVEKNTLIVDYLPVDSIGGAAAQLNLAGIFRKGGAVLFTATWSSESGSSSLNDYFVVVSTEGEIAIFTGSYPGGADWSLVGTAEGPEPLGVNAWFKAGGDIAIETITGLITVSAIKLKDPGALAVDALSSAIEPDWRREASLRRTVPWEAVKWVEKGLLYVSVPSVSVSTAPLVYVKNLATGAWGGPYKGWDARCMLVHNRQLYFGANDGTIRIAEIGGRDGTMPYTGLIGFAWDHIGTPGYTKTVKQARADFITTQPFAVQISASVNYVSSFPSPPNATTDAIPTSLFDVGLWGEAIWDGGTALFPKSTRWVSIGTTGDIFSMQIQIPIGATETPSAELTILHLTYEQGALTV